MISLSLSSKLYFIVDRSSKQVRERYINFLRPNLSSERWTIEEDIKLLGLIKEHGKKWINIEKAMKNRSHYQIKNRFFNRIMGVLKKKILSEKVA